MSKTILAVGAHIGDMELTCGALSRRERRARGTQRDACAHRRGEGRACRSRRCRIPESKVAEAEAFAAELGGEAIVLGYPDGCCRITTRRASPCAMSSAA